MKNNEKLLYTIGEVKDKSVPDVPEKKPKTLWMKLSAVGCGAAAAALLAVVILGGGRGEQPPAISEPVTNYEPQQTPDISENSGITTEQEPPVDWAEFPIYPEFSYQPEEKELVPFSANIGSGGGKGGGAEGVGTYDGVDGLKEILSQNPWNESMEFETLPVFHNMSMDNWLGWSAAGAFMYLSEEQMNLMAENTAYLLGKEITSIDTQYDIYLEGLKEPPTPEQIEAASSKIHTLTAQCADGTVINVDGAGQIIVDFDPSIPLPSEYSLDITKMKQGTADFLVEKFGNLLQFENPEFFTYNPDINNYVYAYDNSGSDVQRILNYNLYNARFYAYDNDKLSDIYIDNAFAAAEYMGDYPVISLEKAREMLLNGKFIANIWDGYIKNGVISQEDIGGVELVYRYMGRNQENYQPYYCFYVELDREEEFAENYPGMTYYGSFYVPAVSEEYISELTEWYDMPMAGNSVPVEITDADVNECWNSIEENSDFSAIDYDIYDIDFDGTDELLILADVPFRAIYVYEKRNGKMVQSENFGTGYLADVEKLELHTYSNNGETYPYFTFHFDNGGVMKCDVIAAIKRGVYDSYYIEYLLSYGTLSYTGIPEPFTKEFYRIGWNKTDIAMDGDYNDISEEEFWELYGRYMDK